MERRVDDDEGGEKELWGDFWGVGVGEYEVEDRDEEEEGEDGWGFGGEGYEGEEGGRCKRRKVG